MATAVSSNAWYSWCSPRLVQKDQSQFSSDITLNDLIPFETVKGQNTPSSGTWKPKLVIGHNVGYDRAFMKEQYYIQRTKLRFLDTMSLHIALTGMTGDQRMLFLARTKGSLRKEVLEFQDRAARFRMDIVYKWTEDSAMNNLNDVYQLHCKVGNIKSIFNFYRFKNPTSKSLWLLTDEH